MLCYIVNDNVPVDCFQQIGDTERAAVQTKEWAVLDRLVRDLIGVFNQPFDLMCDGMGGLDSGAPICARRFRPAV